MGRRKRIGLNLFFDNSTNSGIVNYIYNIVAALYTLPDEERPFILLLHSQHAPVDYIRSVGYPEMETIAFSEQPGKPIFRKVNQLITKLTHKNFYKYWKYYRKIDVLYPYFELMDQQFADYGNKVHWMVDFNNRAFPEHYADKGETMQRFQESLTQRTDKIVLSSQALKNELQQYYPGYKNEVNVLPFASTIQLPESADQESVKQKHQLDGLFFMSPNQFWEHKNQIVLFEAIRILKSKGVTVPFKVVFTGSLQVHRGKGTYATILLQKIEEYGLTDYIVFTGVLERGEQLILMQSSLALIQPSLYEGWSTLVEEAKAMNKFILLSNLPVHREQIDKNVAFFEPHDAAHLALLMEKELREPTPISPLTYEENIKKFGRDILQALT